MDDLILQQTEELGLISRAFKNLKKKGDFSKGDVEARMAALDKRWCQIEERHEQISRKATKEDRSKNYFKTSFMEDAEEQYLDEKAKFLNAIHALDPPPPPRNAADQEYNRSRRKLPPIGIPSFSGKYSEWNSFKDFFTALVASDTCLSDVERLQSYLVCSRKETLSKLPGCASTKGLSINRNLHYKPVFFGHAPTIAAIAALYHTS